MPGFQSDLCKAGSDHIDAETEDSQNDYSVQLADWHDISSVDLMFN